MQHYGLGIDLGTTQTAAAVNVDGRIEVVRLGGRRAEIPSLVFVRADGGLLIGEAAERRGQAEPGRLAREFKRRIGDPVPILAGGVPFSAHALTAKLLRHVLDAVTQLRDGPPDVLTVTHPANWGPYKREQLDQALRLADTGPVLLRTEPEAAALQHATARKIAPGGTVAVYDLGGGTFDAAVLRREGDGFVLLGEPAGIEQLGGADFDEAVLGHVLAVLGDRVRSLDPQSPEAVTALARLRRDCVEAKEALSFDTEVMIPVALPGVHTRVRLNRSELESMIAPALADTVATMHRALRAARVAPAELDAVLLAGGSSRIPLVGQLLAEAFERPVVADPHPEHSIAMGAAVSTALITGGASPFATALTPLPRPVPDPASIAPGDTGSAAGPPSPAVPGAGAAVPTAGAAVPTAGAAVPTAGAAAPTAGIAVPTAGTAVPTVEAAMPTAAPVLTQRADPAATQVARATVDSPPRRPPANGVPPQPAHPGTAFAEDSRATRILPGDGATTRVDQAVGGPAVHGVAGYSRGASPVPEHSGQIFTSASAGTAEPAVKRGRLLVLVGALTLAVIAGTTVLVALNRGDDDQPGKGAQALGGPAASPSVSRPPYPTDTMLIRVDTGGGLPPERRSGVSLLTPGAAGRTVISDTGRDVLPEWSHDRERLALTRYQQDGSNTIWVMDADGKNSEKVADDVTDGRVTWSRDDSRIAFMRTVGGTPQIFVLELGGAAKATQLTRAPGRKDDPAWSPDGTSIAYTRGTGKDTSDIWVIGSDGRNAEQLTDHEAREMDPSWSPDGSWLAFTRGVLEKPKIVIRKIDGGDEQTLTRGDAREGHPCWS